MTQYKEVRIDTMIIPIIVLILGLFCVVAILKKIRGKFRTDMEEAKLKYNTENEFGLETNHWSIIKWTIYNFITFILNIHIVLKLSE